MANKSNIQIKKDKPIINDGGHKPFGVDLDPNKTLKHVTNPDGSYEAYYKDQKMDFNDYIDEMEDRTTKNRNGKDISSRSIGMFGGVSFDDEGKIIKP